MSEYLFINDLDIQLSNALFTEETESSLIETEKCLKQEIQTLLDKADEIKRQINEKGSQLEKVQDKLKSLKESCPEIVLGIPNLTRLSTLDEKAQLLLEMFHGRQDVYALRQWKKEKNRVSYFPCCVNAWKHLLCLKNQKQYDGFKGKRTECDDCKNKKYGQLTPKTIIVGQLGNLDAHGNNAIGVYPILPGNVCKFAAIDFDEETWKSDALTVAGIARNSGFQMAIERSFSGNGAHLWLFFSEEVPASKARKLVFSFLDKACQKSKTIKLRSYDRVFPMQDAIEGDGLGNLILMPLVNGAARRPEPKGTVFVDNKFNTYPDQIAFLSSLPKYSNRDIDIYLSTVEVCGDSLFNLFDGDSVDVLWSRKLPKLSSSDCLGKNLPVFLSAGISIPKNAMSPKLLDALRRMTCFPNPEYYKSAKRNKGYISENISSFIQTSIESNSVLQMPRAFFDKFIQYMDRSGIQCEIRDQRTTNTKLSAVFKGELREEQIPALDALMSNDMGIIKAATSFGKTVVTAKLIAKRKERTLILVQSTVLLDQWKNSLEKFITVENPPEKREGKRVNKTGIGIYSGSKDSVSGFVDIATFQAVSSRMPEFVRNYGMVIVDEVHHCAADTFVKVLQAVRPRYIYGLSATVKRDDNLEKIVYAHCGNVIFEYLASKQAYDRGIIQTIVPRFTFSTISNLVGRTFNYTEATKELSTDATRNNLIASDVEKLVSSGRSVLVLSALIDHTLLLNKLLLEKGITSVLITGSMSTAEKKRAKEEINSKKCSVIISTGKYLGEGTDIPYLDTLMVATPVSWEGVVSQYAGRIAREYEGKKQTLIYDYVDASIPQYVKMYNKRLETYRKLGYNVLQNYSTSEFYEESEPGLFHSEPLFSQFNILEPFINSVRCAKSRIIISSPEIFISRVTKEIIEELKKAQSRGVVVEIRTKPIDDSWNKEAQEESFSYLADQSIPISSSRQAFLRFAVMDISEVWFGGINLLGGAIKKSFDEEAEAKAMMHIFSLSAANSLVDSAIGLLCELGY